MSPEPLNEEIKAVLHQLTTTGARISITAVAAQLGIPRSSLYRNAAARDLIHQRIAETRLDSEKNMALKILRLSTLVGTTAADPTAKPADKPQLQLTPFTKPAITNLWPHNQNQR